MKRCLLTLLALLLIAAALDGCSHETEFAPNREIPYVRYTYDQPTAYGTEVFRNITGTGAAISMKGGESLTYVGQKLTATKDGNSEQNLHSFGTVILRSPAELDSILLRLDRKSSQIAPYIVSKEETCALSFDESFFADRDLLAVDLCSVYAISYLARPEALSVRDGDVALRVSYGFRSAYTASHFGTLLLIPIPKDCGYVEVEYESVKYASNR